jgi:hypothetical protein
VTALTELDEPVWLRVPADARYAGVVRVTVTAFAVRLALPPATVEDLCLSVDEALVLLLGGDESGARSEDGEPAGSIVVVVAAPGDRPPVHLELRLDPAPVEPIGSERLGRFTELVPSSVAIDRADPTGRVVLHHPA